MFSSRLDYFRRKLFLMKKSIIYHILFWFFIFWIVLDSMLFDYQFKKAFFYSLIECGIDAFIAYVNLLFFIPVFLEKKRVVTYAISITIFFLLLFIVYSMSGLGYYLLDEGPYRMAISYSIKFTSLIFISFLAWKVSQYDLEKKKNLELNNQKLEVELLLLKSQVSPHFLFNTLNNIYSLSFEKHDHAPIMIEKLSKILRYLIYEGKKETVLLEKEVNLVKEYVDLQLLKRMKGMDQITLTIEGVESHHQIAPLLLVNLVENCFKHGDVNYNPNGFLKITLFLKKNTLYFHTENSFQQSKKDAGIGVTNIREQLRHHYPETHQFDVHKELNTFKTSLTINLV